MPPPGGKGRGAGWGQLHLAAFDFGNIKDVIDQGKLELGGEGYFVYAFVEAFRIAGVLFGDCGQAYDGAHGRADIMGHA